MAKKKRKELPEPETSELHEEDGLGLFDGKYDPDPETCWNMYERGVSFKNSLNLFDTVRVNENFYIGEQLADTKSLKKPGNLNETTRKVIRGEGLSKVSQPQRIEGEKI